MTDNTKQVVIDRLVEAPIDLVWRMWTDSTHFARWYGPTGASIPSAKMDVREGGKRLICMEMQTPNGLMQMWFCGEYLEVEPVTRLVYTEQMADESGQPKPAEQLPPGHPASTTITLELKAQGEQTKLVLTHAGIPADSPGAMGWKMALDKLDQLLAEN